MQGPDVKYEPHPRGNKGTRKSVRKTVQAAAAGRLSPKVTSWAMDALKAAGAPTDKHGQASALLDAIRRDKFYIPDPVDAERIAMPDCLLAECSGLTLEAGDCDDLSAALAAACESVGIVCVIIGQAFNKQQQYQHILVACEVDDGVWFYADPSDRKLPFGKSYEPTREIWALVPSGKILCDHAPNCVIEMKGLHPDVHDRPTGDGIFIGEGMAGDTLQQPIEEETEPKKSIGWTIFKGVLTIGIVGLAGYGGFRLATGD